MSNARDEILAGIRRSLHRSGPLNESVRTALEARIMTSVAHVKPVFTEDPVERFIAKLEGVAGKVTQAASLADVPDAVTAHIRAHNLPMRIVTGTSELLSSIDWPAHLTVERRAATGDDQIAVTDALAGIAETGTLVMLSSPDSPTTQRFLPEDHLVVVKREQIVRHLEDAWTKVRSEATGIPRVVNFVGGPSKTADVEQTIQVGAHGPRRFHVVLVDG
ncbi:MAG: LutC/YkgG family protein [Gammaproteobacteria bacterium]